MLPTGDETQAPTETTDAPSTTVLPTTTASSNTEVDVEESRGSIFGILLFVFFTVLA